LADGNFAAANPATVGVGSVPKSIVAGDFNRDGFQDFAVTNSGSNTVSIVLGNGDGTFASPVTVSVGGVPTGLAVGEFSLDGRADLAVANTSDNSVSILLNH
jgi:hypothetical protein